ncbi:MAG: CDGSH iron-sulfur domain-containing protein [Verrucomicrobiota bacterium]|nr:CDGSH iron-sulfur domain-containing protein [Limisphaera sp.]MDW8381378.1 CDGSH iron-sulfur domain-containing protein [Verrucomicrobiota bacterium]
MREPKIAADRPYVINVQPGTYWWCACGHSAQQPFCDGSHKGTGLGPVKVVLHTARSVAWCGCKRSGNGAFCDGTHARFAQGTV